MKISYESCKNLDIQTVKIEYLKGEKIIKKYLHSKYDPMAEAKRWAESVYDKENKVYIVYGGAMLYHIMALRNIIDESEDRIIVFEPIKELYGAYKDSVLFNDFKNISYYDVFNAEEIEYIFSNQITSVYYNRCNIHIYTPYMDYDTNKQKELYSGLKLFKTGVFIGFNTTVERKAPVIENFVKNYRHVVDSARIDEFKNAFKDYTAVIVSAGPSLDKNIKDLLGYEDKVIIITGGRTLKALLNTGIKPHFNTSIDMGEANYEMYKKYEILNENIPLISTPESQYRLSRYYKGEKIFSLDKKMSEEIDYEWYGKNIDSLFSAATVATLQISSAVYMGCRKIIFIGQDLAFLDDKMHSSLASNEDNKVYEQKNNVYVKGINQEKILSRNDLNHFRIIIQNYIKNVAPKDCVFIDATEGGAYIEGTQISTLKEALIDIKKSEMDIEKRIKELIKISKTNNTSVDIGNKISDFLKSMESIEKNSKKGIEISSKLKAIENYQGNNRYLLELDKIDKKLKKDKFVFDKVVEYTASLSISVIGQKKQGIEHVLENTRKMYKEINEIAKIYIKALKEDLSEAEEIL